MKNKLKISSMKALIILFSVGISHSIIAQNEFTFQQASESNEISFNGTRDNNDLKLTKKIESDKKFLLVKGNISEDLDIEIEKEAIFFKSGEVKYHPVGKLGYNGEVELGSIWNLKTGWDKEFSYVFVVELKVAKGTLHLGDYKVEVKSIDKNWPQLDSPRLIEVVGSEKIEKFEQDDQLKDATKDNEFDLKLTYQPIKGSFLKLTIEVLSPASKNGEKEKGKNFTFTPNQFFITDKDNNISLCHAFIRDYGDHYTFSENMNHGVMYGSDDKEQLVLIFQIGNSNGTYKIFHNGKEYSSFEIK